MICFELKTATKSLWSSDKSFSDLYKQTQALLVPLVFFVSGLQTMSCSMSLFICIATHFLVLAIVCKFAFCFYSYFALHYIRRPINSLLSSVFVDQVFFANLVFFVNLVFFIMKSSTFP